MQLNRHGYVFKKSSISFLVRLFDRIGALFFRYPKKEQAPSKVIAVLRLDQIGDVVVADAFLTQLHVLHPAAQIHFVTSIAGQKIYQNRTVKKGSSIQSVTAVQASWFQSKSGIRSQWSSFCKLKDALRLIAPDRIIDLRGDVRHILAARMAMPGAYIQSFGITGGRFLLNECHSPDLKAHAIIRNMTFLNRSVDTQKIGLSNLLASEPTEANLPKFDSNKIAIALHPSAGTLAKRWNAKSWASLIENISKYSKYELIWIGDASCTPMMEEIKGLVNSDILNKTHNLIGRVPIESLGTLLASCQALISPDSGPVHIAAAHQVSTIVLFSGTSLPQEWTPWKVRSHILHKAVPCAPCYRTTCNQPRHACMLDITPDEVFDAIEDMLMEVGL